MSRNGEMLMPNGTLSLQLVAAVAIRGYTVVANEPTPTMPADLEQCGGLQVPWHVCSGSSSTQSSTPPTRCWIAWILEALLSDG